MAARGPASAAGTGFRVLSEQVAHEVRSAILRGELQPGERLVEQDLADWLKVSRAPVRDALRLLTREGWVSHVPRRGAVVLGLTVEFVEDAFAVRAALETLAARLAAPLLAPRTLATLDTLVERMREASEPTQGEVDLARLIDLDVEFHRQLTAACRRPVLVRALEAISKWAYCAHLLLLGGVGLLMHGLQRAATRRRALAPA